MKVKHKGIDVSEYQRNVDFKKVKASGIDFVIIRAGYGMYASQKDSMFESHYINAKAAGLNVGAYWYSYAQSVSDAKKEADVCLKVIKGKKFELPIYFDLEEQSQFSKGKSFCDSLVKAFCNKLENANYYAGLYISRSPLQTYISKSVADRYALWIAEYGSACNYNGTYGIWQYTSKGHISGVKGNVDCDYCYVDYPSIIKEAGMNGYKKPASVKPKLDKSGFKLGDKTIGVLAVKMMLLLAYKLKMTKYRVLKDNGFGNGTKLAVNELLLKWGYSRTGIAGSNFIKKLYDEIEKLI